MGKAISYVRNEGGNLSKPASLTWLVMSIYTLSSLPLYGQVPVPDSTVDHTKDEVEWVDMGYRRVPFSNQPGAIASLKIHNRRALTFDKLLQGTSPGVTAVHTSGQPGAVLALQIRGVHSLAAGTQPLYIIDGFPVYNNNSWTNGGLIDGPLLNGLAFLDPADISSIDILKGVGAMALYGSQASNGVVVIRTEKGQAEDQSVEVSVEAGWQSPIREYELANASQFAAFSNKAYTNAGLQEPYSSTESFGNGTDWPREIIHDRPLVQNHRLTFRGGADHFKFMVSGNYRSSLGLIKGSDFERLNLHANVDAEATDRLTLENSLNFGRVSTHTIVTDQNGLEGNFGVVSSSYLFSPLIPSRDQEGALIPFNYFVNDDGTLGLQLQHNFPVVNPVALATAWDNEIQTSRFTDYFSLKYHASDQLSLTASVGLDAIFNDEATFLPGVLQINVPLGGVGASGKMQSLHWTQRYQLDYQLPIGSKHKFTLLGAYASQGYRREILTGESRGFENEALGYFSLSVGKNKTVNSNVIQWGLESFSGQLVYEYLDRYALWLSSRADASSRFGNTLAFFPAVSGIWHVGKEPFFPSDSRISNLTFRVGYGFTGNQEIPPYSRFFFLDEKSAALHGSTINGIGPARIGNSDLEIEKTRMLDFSVNVGLANGKVKLQADYFQHKTDNAIILLPLAGASGFDGRLANGAKISNHGFELSVQAHIPTNYFDWVSQWSLGTVRNEITGLPGQVDELPIGPTVADISDWSILQIGHSVGAFYGYVSDGLVAPGEQPASFAGQDLRAGDRKYKDLNGDGILSPADKTIIGKSLPDINLGFFNQVKYKNVSLSFFVQGLLGRDMANLNHFHLKDPSGNSNVLASFSQGGPTEASPRKSELAKVFSDAIVQEAGFIRLQNVSFSYLLPEKFAEKLPFEQGKFYLSADNLLTFTGYDGIDPDVSHFSQDPLLQGVDFGSYPKSKTWRAGVQIKF